MNEAHYRFAPRDRRGWLLGLQPAQCAILGAGLVAAGGAVRLTNSALGGLVVMAASAVLAFVPIAGTPLYELAPTAGLWLLQHMFRFDPWFGLLTWQPPTKASDQVVFPPSFGPITIDDADAPGWAIRGRPARIGVITDDSTVTLVLRVRGRQFALVERADQDRLVGLWGEALAGFCAEHSPVARIAWSEWAAPAGLDDQLAWAADHTTAAADAQPLVDYLALLGEAGPMATRHDILVTVTVEARRTRHRAGTDPVGVLVEQARLLTTRLETAGLTVDPPLSAAEITRAVAVRCDPASGRTLRAHTLAELPAPFGPGAVENRWRHVACDSVVHASYWIAEWPRLEVPANWLEPVLLHAGGVRTVTVIYQPVPPSVSHRQIDRDATRLAVDEEQRSRGGFRVGARHRRIRASVAEREAELVAGYAELTYAGLITITAPNPDALEAGCADYEQVAAQAGMVLRRLDGRHDLALAATLPLGRTVTARRWS